MQKIKEGSESNNNNNNKRANILLIKWLGGGKILGFGISASLELFPTEQLQRSSTRNVQGQLGGICGNNPGERKSGEEELKAWGKCCAPQRKSEVAPFSAPPLPNPFFLFTTKCLPSGKKIIKIESIKLQHWSKCREISLLETQ